MKIDRSNYNTFFFENLRSKLVIIENKRKHSLQLFILLCFPLGTFFFFQFYKIQKYNLVLASLLIIPLVAIVLFLFKLVFSKYKVFYKTKVIPLIFNEIFDKHNYYPNLFLSEAEFSSSMLYQKTYNRFSGEDLIEGLFNGLKLKMSELTVKYVQKSGKNKSEKIVFKGILINCEIKTPYWGETVVEPDVTVSYLGHLGKMLQFKNKLNHEVIRLESIDFEKLFVVRASDQIESRKILSPIVQERLTTLAKKYKIVFGFSVSSKQLSIAIPNQINYFEPEYFSSNMSGKSIRQIVEIFLFIQDLTEEIQNGIK